MQVRAFQDQDGMKGVADTLPNLQYFALQCPTETDCWVKIIRDGEGRYCGVEPDYTVKVLEWGNFSPWCLIDRSLRGQ
jgi:hypothetical protein